MGEEGAIIGQEEPNPFLVNNPDGGNESKKPKKTRAFALKPEDVVQPGLGLDRLYI